MMQHPKSIEAIYTQQVSLEHRKKFAQFFTPRDIAVFMAEWLLGNENLHTVLEPAFGLGIFSRILLSQKPDIQIKGFEIDNVIYQIAMKESIKTNKMNIMLEDYMYNDWMNQYDGIICNPPYFKFHDYDNKKILKEIEQKLHCKLNGFTNLYTLFLLKSIHQLKPNGRCAYIIPSEFLNSDYGELVKTHLIQSGTLRHIIVFDFEENVFDDALTTASIILCANDNRSDRVQFSNIKSKEDLKTMSSIIEKYPEHSNSPFSYRIQDLNPAIKWKAYYQPQNGNRFKYLVPFSSYAKVVRGIATGSNDFFTFNISKAKKFGIDEKYLMPCICHSIDVSGFRFDHSDFEQLKRSDKKVYLFNAQATHDENVINYLAKGKTDRIDQKYLTKSRNPWYAIEKRKVAPIWVSVFNRSGLRFVRNDAQISNLTTFHCVYPQNDLYTDISIDLLFAYLLTPTARFIFEDNSREYGNGLQKYEPNDLNKGKMLDISRLSVDSKRKIEQLYHLYKNSKDVEYLHDIDTAFIEHFSIE